MSDKPIIAVNHAARAWASFVTAFGAFAEMLQHSLPEIQRLYPDIKWVGPTVFFIGFAWGTIQRIQDAQKQGASL